jgi:hypothetical protein
MGISENLEPRSSFCACTSNFTTFEQGYLGHYILLVVIGYPIWIYQTLCAVSSEHLSDFLYQVHSLKLLMIGRFSSSCGFFYEKQFD